MPVSGSTWTGLRDQLAATLDTVAGLKVYDHDPLRDLDPLPALTLGFPTIERTRARELEESMSSDTVTALWPAQLVVLQGEDPRDASAALLAMVGAIGGAIDGDKGLTTLLGTTPPHTPTAKLVRAAPSAEQRPDGELATFRYDLEIEVALNPRSTT